MPDDLPINDRLTIPSRLLRISVSRSGGPGGQHVNTTDTKVHLYFHIDGFAELHAAARERVKAARRNDLNSDGELQITADVHRSRHQNEEEARSRLVAVIKAHLIPPKKRRKTKPSRAAKRRRMDAKKQRGEKKVTRGKVKNWD